MEFLRKSHKLRNHQYDNPCLLNLTRSRALEKW